MLIEFDRPRIVVSAPAKVNLFLEVVAKLPSGFHKIDTLMCPIDLCDKLIFEEKKDPTIRFRLELPADRCFSSGEAWDIPNDRTNLVVRAVERVRERLGAGSGCDVTLVKRIPASAGLGGGSSNAAAAIVASMVLWGGWNRSVAAEIAAELGSDINFFFGDQRLGVGLARCSGRGELVTMLPWQPQLFFTVSHPPQGCSTKDVYQRCRIAPRLRTSEPMAQACRYARIEAVGRELFNALQQPATQINEWIPIQMDYFKRIGARYCLMTGSGSACFALAPALRPAEEMACQMHSLGLARAWAAQAWYARPIERQLIGKIAAQRVPESA